MKINYYFIFIVIFFYVLCGPSVWISGSDGKLHDKVFSTAGVRQGSPLSTLLFCTMMQPILATLALEFPSIKIFAYIDDITFASDDPALLTKAFIECGIC